MTKTEKILLAATAVFFLLVLLLLPRGGHVRRTEPAFALPAAAPASAEPEDAVWITLETRIDINHATAKELTALPGVGEVTARAIVEYRNTHGPFASVEDLLLVPGIGEATLNAILAAGGGQ